MKRWTLFALAIAACGLVAVTGCNQAEDTAETPDEVTMEPAPLLERELFFGDPEISGSQLSPDGKWMSFIKPYEGTRNIWVKAADAPFESAKPVTADDRPVPGYFWSRDSEFILYVQDKDGDENFHVYAVNPAGEPAARGVPAARNLTPVAGVRAQIYSVPKNNPDIMLVGMNDRDPRFHDIYKVDIATGERTMVKQNDEGVGFWIFDLEGELRMAYRQLPDGGSELLRVTMDGLEQVARMDAGNRSRRTLQQALAIPRERDHGAMAALPDPCRDQPDDGAEGRAQCRQDGRRPEDLAGQGC